MAASGCLSLITLLASSFEAYRARHLPIQFNETRYIAFSNLILLENLLIGMPAIFIARNDPTIFTLVLNVLLCIMCLGVLLPVFVPKFTNAHDVKSRRFVERASHESENRTSQDSK